MKHLLSAAFLTLAATTAHAEGLLAEASGNWAGTSNQGFYFRATLEQNADMGWLKIWQATDAVPTGGEPELSNPDFILTAFSAEGSPALYAIETADGTILQVVTEFADETGEGRGTIDIQFIDNMFTVIGASEVIQFYNGDGTLQPYSCTVDLLAGRVNVNGTSSTLPPLQEDAANASAWRAGALFDRGWCPLP